MNDELRVDDSIILENYLMRPIKPSDNKHIKDIIIDSLAMFGLSGEGCSAGDENLGDLYSVFDEFSRMNPNLVSGYWVVEDRENKEILGGGGVAPLLGLPVSDRICEFQKFYFKTSLRGKGFGKFFLSQCILFAKKSYNGMYLETLGCMENARGLYRTLGFEYLDQRLGNTGHYKMNVPMFLKLK